MMIAEWNHHQKKKTHIDLTVYNVYQIKAEISHNIPYPVNNIFRLSLKSQNKKTSPKLLQTETEFLKLFKRRKLFLCFEWLNTHSNSPDMWWPYLA